MSTTLKIKTSIPDNKLCPNCNIIKSKEFFKTRKCKNKYGIYVYLSSYCKECSMQKEYARIHKKRKKAAEQKDKELKEKLQLGYWFCIQCKKDHFVEEFYEDKRNKYGLLNYCKKYNSEYRKDYRKKNPEDHKKWRNNFINTRPEYQWACGSYYGHINNGYKLKFTIVDLEQIALKNQNCVFCGIKLCYLKKGKKDKKPTKNSPTLENLNLKKVLNLKDICIICYDCNTLKNKRTLKEFFDFCRIIKNNNLLMQKNNYDEYNFNNLLEISKKDIYSWSRTTLNRHSFYGNKFNFDKFDLSFLAANTDTCSYCNSEFSRIRKSMRLRSLDNKNILKELGKNDISIVCSLCNISKGKRTLKNFVSLCSKIFNNKNKITEKIHAAQL